MNIEMYEGDRKKLQGCVRKILGIMFTAGLFRTRYGIVCQQMLRRLYPAMSVSHRHLIENFERTGTLKRLREDVGDEGKCQETVSPFDLEGKTTSKQDFLSFLGRWFWNIVRRERYIALDQYTRDRQLDQTITPLIAEFIEIALVYCRDATPVLRLVRILYPTVYEKLKRPLNLDQYKLPNEPIPSVNFSISRDRVQKGTNEWHNAPNFLTLGVAIAIGSSSNRR